MEFELHSYRFAQEIIEHRNYTGAFQEITGVVRQCPLFTFPNKSNKNRRLDVVQQLFNTFFDRRFACDLGWLFHPNATSIQGSGLAADYRKIFNGLRIQAEVQFGNMSRWYSDIFKFQTAYSQDLIDMGLCIVPMSSIANRMDSNVTNFERCVRELPSAKLSITLPILLIGMEMEAGTPIVDTSTSGIARANGLIAGDIRNITARGKTANRYRIVNGFLNGAPVNTIYESSDTGPVASLADPEE
ncbi:BglII/BstYI family type II restriction endonuclease [Niabella yanshanensis]|uniref:BglII/BstYI family type II restriction endonuclease n=1 Tax=Niabella yanshanensis TaxID=577386 RepID=A0ABZ0W982_9BACT|nr:BglII/BstYI family type II restriction endonuclease [Niabella yanshanensis]WQD39057.1 BglII/BstYI family type II restriction endonuclease [Niabella yanshanensis]